VAPADGSSVATPPSTQRVARDHRSYTPRHLAEKILSSKSALEGERKQVTVFFADVKSSMQLSEELDPEEWHAILERFFEILSAGVHRFEGTVNQYTGDGIMALFGAPVAHEDHAQRACYAALHLSDALKVYTDQLRVDRGLNFSVRMGINSGEVVVGKIGDDLRMDYTAQGHTVGLAQRMESLAAGGKALLAGTTIDLVRGYFDLRDLGETTVKGVEEPVRVAELQGIGAMRTRLDRSRARALEVRRSRRRACAARDGARARPGWRWPGGGCRRRGGLWQIAPLLRVHREVPLAGQRWIARFATIGRPASLSWRNRWRVGSSSDEPCSDTLGRLRSQEGQGWRSRRSSSRR
jgi:class 3 adenylate cyclase